MRTNFRLLKKSMKRRFRILKKIMKRRRKRLGPDIPRISRDSRNRV